MFRTMVFSWLRVLCCLAGFFAVRLVAAETYAPFRPDLPAGAAYRIDATRLHPTQFSVGLREVRYKRAAIDTFDAAQLAAYLRDKDVPLVIGPGGVPYLTDGHHTISALLASAQADKTVYGHVLANWSDLTPADFWARMQAKNLTYLKDAAGRPQPPEKLPGSLRDLQHDVYRGLAWAVMKAGGFAEIKPPKLFFQEFFWADFYRTRLHWNDADEQDFARVLAEAVALSRRPEAAGLPGYRGAP